MQRLRLTSLITLFFMLFSLVHAGVTGKITGVVIDEQSGEPMIGVNILVKGTSLGAASDMEGHFIILNVPPAEYTLVASFIGYAKLNLNSVRVYIDQTTKVQISMTVEVIEGAEITVVAQENLVKDDVATSVSSFTSDEIAALPVSNLAQVVGLQAGVENGLNVRGGGANELLFQINNITMRDPRNNQPIAGVALSAVKEVSIERGGFNAEYGQVRSGIVNVIAREGGKDSYSFTSTIKYASSSPKHLGISPYDKNSMWLRPYLDDDVSWVGTANGSWDKYTQKQYPSFDGWNAISHRLLSDNDPTNDLSPAAAQKLFMWEFRQKPIIEQPDYNIDAGFGGPVPVVSKALGDLRFFLSYRKHRSMLLVPLARDDYADQDWMLQLTSDISNNMKLKITGMAGWSSNIAQNGTEQVTSTDYLRSPYQIAVNTDRLPARIFSNSWYSLADIKHKTGAIEFTHTINPKSYYTVRSEYVSHSYETGPIAKRDTTNNIEIVPGYFVNEAPFGFSPYADVGITGMFFGGHTSTARDSTQSTAITIKADYTNQMDSKNLMKIGAEFAYTNLNLDYGVVNTVFPESNNYIKMQKQPIRSALYIQDKLEAEGYIISMGLRMDYNNANTQWALFDAFSNEWKDYHSTKFDEEIEYALDKSKAEVSFSPRLSVSHPITTYSKMFFNYGHFKQQPTYEEIFALGRNSSGATRSFGNPELMMEKTVSYELGYDHVINDIYLVQFSGYYHDILDQQSTTTFYSADKSIIFESANNNSYEDIRGFELTLRKNSGKYWTGFANYTYQVNTSGLFGKSRIYENPSEQREYNNNTRELYQNKPTPQPYARTSISTFTPQKFGPRIMGLYPLGGWLLNTTASWKEGYYYFARNVYPGVSPNETQRIKGKDWYDVVLTFRKKININNILVTFFVDVDNALNIKRLSLASFYDFEDRLAYYESLSLPESSAYNNIIGDDLVGEYRSPDVDYQPIENTQSLQNIQSDDVQINAIYYERSSDSYYEFAEGDWVEVSKSRMNTILEEKAYIDMPNQTSFNFLNPRQVFFGLTVSYEF